MRIPHPRLSSVMYCIITLLLSAHSTGQTIVIPDTLKGWENDLRINLNGAQASFENWSEGGVNTISGTFSSNYTKIYRSDLFAFGIRINGRYGQARFNKNTRKCDDLFIIRTRSTFAFSASSRLSSYGTVMLRTQFRDGFEYNAKRNPTGADSLISGFFAPAYITEGIGVSFNAEKSFQMEAGLGLKQTIVMREDLASNYGLKQGAIYRFEGGLTTGLTFQKEVFKNVQYNTDIETFTNLLHPINETDVYWTNEFIGRINSTLQASLQFELRYDYDFSTDIQLKQVLSAGISMDLF